MAFGGFVLLAVALLVDAAYWPLWGLLPLAPVDQPGIGFERDLPWLLNKAALCLLLSLPFAIWRAFQNRSQSPVGPDSVISTI